MTIEKCPECSYQILDQLPSCPKCGRPFTMNSAFNDVPLPDVGIYTSDDGIYMQDMTAGSKTSDSF